MWLQLLDAWRTGPLLPKVVILSIPLLPVLCALLAYVVDNVKIEQKSKRARAGLRRGL